MWFLILDLEPVDGTATNEAREFEGPRPDKLFHPMFISHKHLNFSPTGEKQRTMWRFVLIRSRNLLEWKISDDCSFHKIFFICWKITPCLVNQSQDKLATEQNNILKENLVIIFKVVFTLRIEQQKENGGLSKVGVLLVSSLVFSNHSLLFLPFSNYLDEYWVYRNKSILLRRWML